MHVARAVGPRSVVLRSLTHACRGDAVPERLTYFEVRVGDTPASTDPTANAVCASYDSPTQSVYTFACSSPTPGRYLVVRLRPEYSSLRPGSVLTLCEVNAYGALPAPPPPSPIPR